MGGGKKLTSAQKWKLKKQLATSGGGSSASGSAGVTPPDNMQKMLRLTELANTIVESGNMDVYGETFEMITVKVNITAILTNYMA